MTQSHASPTGSVRHPYRSRPRAPSAARRPIRPRRPDPAQRLSRVERREDCLEHLTATEGLRNGHIPGRSRALARILSGSRHDASPTCAMDSAPSGARYRPLTPGPAPSRTRSATDRPVVAVPTGFSDRRRATVAWCASRSTPEGRHYSRRARCAQEQEEDRRSWPCPSSTSRSGLCSVQWFGDVVAWTSRTSSCWSCATNSMFCAARSRGRSFAPLIVPCSRRRPATCHARHAKRVWSPRERCCGGIAYSCAGNGGSRPAGADAHPSRLREGTS